MISTKDYTLLPDPKILQTICKAISVLDAILSQEWEYRYYSYNNKWSDNEEFFEMRDGSGDQMLVLFSPKGCVINGFAHEYPPSDKHQLTANLPSAFNEFILENPLTQSEQHFVYGLPTKKTGKQGSFKVMMTILQNC